MNPAPNIKVQSYCAPSFSISHQACTTPQGQSPSSHAGASSLSKLIYWLNRVNRTNSEQSFTQNRLFSCINIQNAALHRKEYSKTDTELQSKVKLLSLSLTPSKSSSLVLEPPQANLQISNKPSKRQVKLNSKGKKLPQRDDSMKSSPIQFQLKKSHYVSIYGKARISQRKRKKFAVHKPLRPKLQKTQIVKQEQQMQAKPKLQKRGKPAEMRLNIKPIGQVKSEQQKSQQMLLYQDFINVVSYSNFRRFQCKTSPTVYVSKLNNGGMVMSFLRKRYWFTFEQEFTQSTNFVWTSKIAPLKTPVAIAQFSQMVQANLDQIGSKSKLVGKLVTTVEKKFGSKQPPFLKGIHHLPPTDSSTIRVRNYLPDSKSISTKRGLFLSLKKYFSNLRTDLQQNLPVTFIVQARDSAKLAKVKTEVDTMGGVWIVKPGEDSNRGLGIVVVSSSMEIQERVQLDFSRSYVIQKYIESPLLYKKRKFDIRTFLLVTTVFGCVKGYFYEDGYVRTSSYQFSLSNLEGKIHLTNDAMQSKFEGYGRFQKANKLSLGELRKYFQENGSNFLKVWSKIKDLTAKVIEASYKDIGANEVEVSFQLFGLDFMVDSRGQVLLIEANDNPCLQTNGSVLSVLIPQLVENTLRVALDPIFPPQSSRFRSKFQFANPYLLNKYSLVFDSIRTL